MSNKDYYDFMVWHRGLAVPRARNLNDKQVQEGKKLFMSWGCASCHKPSWKTGDDNYVTSKYLADKKLPRYQNQTIYPYSDFVQHKLYMMNDIHGSWCHSTLGPWLELREYRCRRPPARLPCPQRGGSHHVALLQQEESCLQCSHELLQGT